MYLRQQTRLPSSTVLQVTGQLTIHHPQPTIQHSLHPLHYPMQHSPMHEYQTMHSRKSEYQSRERSFKKEAREPYEAHSFQSQTPKQQESVEETEQKKRENQQTKNNIQSRGKDGEKDQQKGREKGTRTESSRKTEQRQPQRTRPLPKLSHAKQLCQQSAGRMLGLETLRELGDQLQKMEETWNSNNQSLNFQTLYQLRQIREDLERQTLSILVQLEQQIEPLKSSIQREKQELQKEKSLLEKEKHEWKTEKEQVMKEMEILVEVMLEEERKQAERIEQEKSAQLKEIISKQFETEKTRLSGEVEKVQQRLNLEVDEAEVNQILYDSFNQMANHFTRLREKINPILESKKIRDLASEEFLEKMEKLVDKTTPYFSFFQVNKNVITYKQEEQEEQVNWFEMSPFLQFHRMVLLDKVIGNELFSFLVRIYDTQGLTMRIGVTDRITQRNKCVPDPDHSICFIASQILYGTVESDEMGKKWKSQLAEWMYNGMCLKVQVDRKNCTVTFIVWGPYQDDENRVYKVYSPILSQPGREFVPCFTMQQQGQTIDFQIWK